jgi:hypothetical protein
MLVRPYTDRKQPAKNHYYDKEYEAADQGRGIFESQHIRQYQRQHGHQKQFPGF